LYIEVSEGTKTIKQLLKCAKTWKYPRLLMLLEMKKADTKGITKEYVLNSNKFSTEDTKKKQRTQRIDNQYQ